MNDTERMIFQADGVRDSVKDGPRMRECHAEFITPDRTVRLRRQETDEIYSEIFLNVRNE